MELYNELYNEFYPEFSAKFERKNLNFDEHFNRLYNATHATPENPFREQIKQGLVAILQAYSETEATTKGGRIARFFAGVASVFIKISSYIKFKKK